MSGLFTLVSSILMSVIGDSSQNNWFGGDPRNPITYTNGPGSPPALGPILEGEAITRANDVKDFYQARIFWLGNEQLAAKYGTTTPEALTPVEEEIWARQVAVLRFTMARITQLLPSVEGLQALKTATAPPQKANEGPPQTANGAPPQTANGAPPQTANGAPVSLLDRYKAASPEEREELLKNLFAGEAR